MGGATSKLVVLAAIGKQAEQTNEEQGSKQHSSILCIRCYLQAPASFKELTQDTLSPKTPSFLHKLLLVTMFVTVLETIRHILTSTL